MRNQKKILESERASAIDALVIKATEPAAEIPLPKESWAFVGYTSPENILESLLWAQTKGDMKKILGTLAPKALDEFNSALKRKALTPDAVMSASKVKGVTVLKKVPLTEDQMLLRIRNEMKDGTENFITTTLKQINGEWKIQSSRAE